MLIYMNTASVLEASLDYAENEGATRQPRLEEEISLLRVILQGSGRSPVSCPLPRPWPSAHLPDYYTS